MSNADDADPGKRQGHAGGQLERLRELGSLERIACWTKRGAPARSAVGMAELPFQIPVEIEGEVEIERG